MEDEPDMPGKPVFLGKPDSGGETSRRLSLPIAAFTSLSSKNSRRDGIAREAVLSVPKFGQHGNHRQWKSSREAWAALVATGTVMCGAPGCSRPIRPGEPWDLGHTIDRALGGEGGPVSPWHRSCNRGAGGRLGTTIQQRKTPGLPPSRQ